MNITTATAARIARADAVSWGRALERATRTAAAALVAVYVAGLLLGAWLHRLNEALAAAASKPHRQPPPPLLEAASDSRGPGGTRQRPRPAPQNQPGTELHQQSAAKPKASTRRRAGVKAAQRPATATARPARRRALATAGGDR
jgi:hypothetical protein